MAEKLNFRIHNPNSEAAMAAYLFELFIEVNANKVDQVLGEMSKNEKIFENMEYLVENDVLKCNA